MKIRNVVIKYQGLVILRDNQVRLISRIPHLSIEDGSLEEILNSQQATDTYNKCRDSFLKNSKDKKLKLKLKKIENLFSNLFSKNDEINIPIQNLRKANSKEELVMIYQELLQYFRTKERIILEEYYEKYPDLILSIMVKSIVMGYVESQFKKMNPSKIIMLQKRKLSNEKLTTLMEDTFELDFSEKSTNNVDNLLAKVFNDSLDNNFLELSSECIECANGYTSLCEKITDYPVKKDIEDYPFIIDGYQVYVRNKLSQFIVARCNNFEKASQHESLSPQRINKLKQDYIDRLTDVEEQEDPLINRNRWLPSKKKISRRLH